MFRCPSPAEDKDGVAGRCDGQCYVKPEGRLPDSGPLPRCSEEWKTEYKKRTVIERHFSSAKHSRLLNQHRYLNIFQMSLHVLMSMLSYLATALAHLQADDYAHMRHMRVKLPKAPGSERGGFCCHRHAATPIAPVAIGGSSLHSSATADASMSDQQAVDRWPPRNPGHVAVRLVRR